jgi:hypothetical protein
MTIEIPNTEIVFVQLGQTKYQHLFPNLELVHEMFPDIKIHCIVSKGSSLARKIPSFVNVFTYEPDSEINQMFDSKTIDPNFRKGFWRYSLERLIAIESFHEKNRNQRYLHVESDILLLPHFPLHKFGELKHVCWLPVSPVTDIASLVYFPDYESTKEFKKDLLKYLGYSMQPTDMEGLFHLRHKFPHKYKTLPISHTSLPKLNIVEAVTCPESKVDFDGIFDASNIGMWLTGIDPRNTYGFLELFATKKIVINDSFIDPSSYTIKFSKENGLYFENGNEQICIYNLHIHSKSSKIFSKKWSKEIAELTLLSHKNKIRRKFYPKILIRLFLDNIKNGTFLEFLYNSPIMFYARRFKFFLDRPSRKSG